MNLDSLSDQLSACIAANEAAEVDSAGRRVLDILTRQARRYLASVKAHQARPVEGVYGTAGYFSENGHLPAIRDIVRQSERQREIGRQRRAA